MKYSRDQNSLKQRGTTLIEVMLACTLGMFLMAGLIQTYLTCKKTFNLQQAIITLQQNGYYAVYFLNQNIRMAGYAGCESSTPPFIKPDSAIVGYENKLPPVLKGKVVNGTGSIIIGNCRIENGKQRYNQYAFFISPTSRKDRLGKSISSLYEMPIDGSKRELVPDVEQMLISYGTMTPDGENIAHYESADKVKDWRAVRAVEILLLVNSEQPILTRPEAYTFAGKIMPADRYLHREWSTYIAMREKL